MNIEAKPFTDTLGEIEGGQLLADLTRQLHTITRAVMETRKAGSLKLTIALAPTGRGAVGVDARIDVKVPEHDRPSTTFFVDEGGTLIRNDPNQPLLPLREVPAARGPLRQVGD